MSIFRDLVEELKEENLLEETVIDPVSEERDSVNSATEELLPASVSDDKKSVKSNEFEALSEPQVEKVSGDVVVAEDPSVAASPEPQAEEQIDFSNSEFEFKVVEPEVKPAEIELVTDVVEVERASESSSEESVPVGNVLEFDVGEEMPASEELDPEEQEKILEEERLFYRQRAIDEVTGLQLVEHVLTGVEREQMKNAPKNFDDLAVKRSLHDFLKVVDNPNTPEHSQAEFNLMQETENWASSLSRRDGNILVSHLRRYCETTKPSLSSQALISLARFYRNSPFSDAVRSKFDFVITKLFSKDANNDKRQVVFKGEELVKHIQELYADWSSVPLYATEEDDSHLQLSALKFEDFISEAKSADSFDQMVKNDFFKRIKVFKAKTSENFFAPVVVAAAIESNIAVGNRYVELIELERNRNSQDEIEDKYGVEYDEYISESASKTLELLDLLRDQMPEEEKTVVAPPPRAPAPVAVAEPEVEEPEEDAGPRFTVTGGVNKWLIVLTVLVSMFTVWHFWAGGGASDDSDSRANGKAKVFNLEGTSLNKHVHSARISKNTLFGITRDSWSELSKDEKQEVVKMAVEMGLKNEFVKVHLLDSNGQSLAFGSKAKVKVY